MKRLIRLLMPLLAFSCGASVMLLFLSPAHADPVIAVTPAGVELSWQAWTLVILAAAGGALKILDVAIAGLGWLAPRTTTKLDDTARDDLQLLRNDIAAVLRVVGGLVPATGAPAVSAIADKPVPALVRDPQAGRVQLGTVVAVALIAAALAGVAMIGCAARQGAAAGTIAALNCEADHLDASVVADLKAAAAAKVEGWISGKAPAVAIALIDKAKADLAGFRSDAGRCAFVGVLAAATTVVGSTSGTTVATQSLTGLGGLGAAEMPTSPATVRAAFQAAARELGWPPVKIAGGAVL